MNGNDWLETVFICSAGWLGSSEKGGLRFGFFETYMYFDLRIDEL